MNVFISHSETDKAVAQRLATDLAHRGIIASSDIESPRPGETIQNAISRAISDASAIILLISSGARSDWQQFEWRKALECAWTDPRKQLLGVLIGVREPPPFLTDWKVMKLDRDGSDWNRVVDELANSVREPATTRPQHDWRVLAPGRANELETWVEALSPNPDLLRREKDRLLGLIRDTATENKTLCDRLFELAVVERELGDVEAARVSLLQAVEISSKQPSTRQKGVLLVSLAAIERRLGSTDSAINRLQEALAIYTSLNLSSEILSTLSLLASFYRESGRPDIGKQYLEQARKLAAQIGPTAYPSAETLDLMSQEYARSRPD